MESVIPFAGKPYLFGPKLHYEYSKLCYANLQTPDIHLWWYRKGMCHDFIWGSTSEVQKNHLISWETICAPKELGGLGFRSLRMVNAAYLTKLGWHLLTNREALWVQVLRFKYGCGNLIIPSMKCSSRPSHLWRGICEFWPFVAQGIKWSVNNRQGVKFWKDH